MLTQDIVLFRKPEHPRKYTVMSDSNTASKAPGSAWHYAPDVPITQAPYCEWPMKPLKCLLYILKTWSPLSFRFYVLMAAIAIWTWFTPSLERTIVFQFDWMFEVWLRNFIMVGTIAGGLHLWFYTFRKQEDELRYDTRPSPNPKGFHFGSQVRDNMFWTLGSAVLIGTLFECLMLWAYANGYAAMVTFDENPWWFVGLFVLIPFWTGFHFYWYHRGLHFEPFYSKIHSWHHKNVNTGPWSGHAMHPLEHVGLYSDSLIYFLLLSHPVHMQFGLLMHTLDGPVSHCGFDKLRIGKSSGVQVGDFMHQLHHRFFDCNYGTYETPWDKIFGSFHDGTKEGDRLIAERRKAMRKARGGARGTASAKRAVQG